MINRKTKTIIDFDSVFKEYNSYVFKIVINESNKMLTKEDQEELVSDIFFQLWKNQKNIKDINKIKSYIGQIAKNTTKNKLRTIKDQVSFDENILVDFKSSSDSYHANEQLKLINEELKEMNEDDRDIFIMYYYNNKKVKDIAVIKDMKISTIKTRLHRIRKKLKRFLMKEGF
ncbi:MAG: sigma-70 family RNA polymerase sigma factor [Tenericutes bacterium]|nr:sigma-70 family RNA polymerase sigma factor [Mycoplasmatota bacterium]